MREQLPSEREQLQPKGPPGNTVPAGASFPLRRRCEAWLLSDLRIPKTMHTSEEEQHAWWRVMCLTGVDYFSTLGYQPGIAFLAAGVLSPVATLVLVAVTLFAALPVYRRVANASPNGQGSIAMLEKLFPGWKGKTFVLVLLGFATTDFVITMTLSAADAAAHVTHNPFAPTWMKSQMGVTLALLAILGGVFLRGFKEAIQIAVPLVAAYLTLNGVVAAVALWHIAEQPHLLLDWKQAVLAQHPHPLAILGLALILFPKLALGLSGFETGVAVMPLIRGKNTKERIANTSRLLTTAAVIMSVFLFVTSIASTLLIPAKLFQSGGPANGRAMAYLAHQYLGNTFGSIYDLSTIAILAFAGASAMAGLLNLIPRYLPRYGMAPEWALASRPLVLVFIAVSFTVTLLFHADIDAQGGAYATGVLVLITSAACAVTVSLWKQKLRWPFLFVAIVFVYTTVLNMGERPEGIKIASFFILAMIVTSVTSRALRSTELRVTGVKLDLTTKRLLAEDHDQIIHLVAIGSRKDEKELDSIDADLRAIYNLAPDECLYFCQIERGDASEFADKLSVHGEMFGKHRILHARSPVVANSIAALLIHLEEVMGKPPHVYFHWTEGNPIANLISFLLLGEGDAAPITHEVLRRAVKDPRRRPLVHVS